MKSALQDYYRLEKHELDKLWKDRLFSLDANVLLDLYRYTSSTQQALFNILKKLRDRIWLTYQAALEYQDNRIEVITSAHRAYDEVCELAEELVGSFSKDLEKYSVHPAVEPKQLAKLRQ